MPGGVKFQVSVPTAYASVVAWIREEDHERFFPVYARAIADEVAAIADAVPAADLLIQYDVAVEVGALTGAFAAARPAGREGLHRGRPSARRSKRPPARSSAACTSATATTTTATSPFPEDLSLCVELATAAGERADFVHMPADRDTGRDPGYFEPLQDLRSGPPRARGDRLRGRSGAHARAGGRGDDRKWGTRVRRGHRVRHGPYRRARAQDARRWSSCSSCTRRTPSPSADASCNGANRSDPILACLRRNLLHAAEEVPMRALRRLAGGSAP